MSEQDDRREETLPVTAEVGSEGGSFADPTHQVSTFEGDIERTTGRGGASSSATQALRSGGIGGTGASPASAADGILRYPTELPHTPSASQGGRAWKMGLAGAAAGAAVAFALSTLRRRTPSEPS
jgi:hypothetical protein